jgi:hypothetical protein
MLVEVFAAREDKSTRADCLLAPPPVAAIPVSISSRFVAASAPPGVVIAQAASAGGVVPLSQDQSIKHPPRRSCARTLAAGAVAGVGASASILRCWPRVRVRGVCAMAPPKRAGSGETQSSFCLASSLPAALLKTRGVLAGPVAPASPLHLG